MGRVSALVLMPADRDQQTIILLIYITLPELLLNLNQSQRWVTAIRQVLVMTIVKKILVNAKGLILIHQNQLISGSQILTILLLQILYILLHQQQISTQRQSTTLRQLDLTILHPSITHPVRTLLQLTTLLPPDL